MIVGLGSPREPFVFRAKGASFLQVEGGHPSYKSFMTYFRKEGWRKVRVTFLLQLFSFSLKYTICHSATIGGSVS